MNEPAVHLQTLSPPVLEHFCDLIVELGPVEEMGMGRAGARRIIPIIGGTVNGAEIRGRVMNVGADWQTIFHGGVAELDTRYAIETDDGAVIEVQNFGYRHGPEHVLADVADGKNVPFDAYYMRTHARLETGDERYNWVNKTLFIGTGGRRKSSVELSLFAIA